MSSTTFSAASERLVADKVAPRGALDTVEAALDKRLPGQPIEFDGLAAATGVGDVTLQRILDGYADAGLIARREHVRCPQCKLLEDASTVRRAREAEEDLQCTNCETELVMRDDPLPEEAAYYIL
jgi:hypothetical protein